MIEKWELAHFPFEKDALRYKARLRGTENDLKELVAKLPVECGNPFVTLSQDYDWAFYLYNLDPAKLSKAREVFNSFSRNGSVIESAALHVEKELPPMLEDVLEVAARHLVNTAEKETEKNRPEEKPDASKTQRFQVGSPKEEREKPPASSASSADKSAEKPASEMEGILSNPLNPSYTFSSFIVGPNNRFTHAAALAVGENPGKIYNPLFVHGGVGLGKTHLMQAIGHMIVSRNAQMKIVFISTEKFTSLVIEGIRKGHINQLREQFRNLDVLLIDDVQFLSGSESTQEEFFHVFNGLHHLGKQIVITSDRPPKQLSTLEDRLRSRFEWGLITDLKAPNLETRIALLKSKSEQMNLTLTNDQLHYVAEKSKSNIRELEGLVKKIFATTSLMNVKVDLQMLEGLFGETGAEAPAVSQAAQKAAPPAPSVQEKPKEIKKPPGKEEAKSTELEGMIERLNQAVKSEPAASADKPADKSVDKVTDKPAGKSESEPVLQGAARFAPPPSSPKPETPPAASATSATSADMSADKPTGRTPLPQGNEKIEIAARAASEDMPDPDDPETDMTLRAVEVICFYPKGKKEDYRKLRDKFNLILKKHKLKFRLSRIAEKTFDYEEKIDYGFFARECRKAGCSNALVLGPPPTPLLSEDDFAGMLSSALEEERISLQFIPWSEMGKDYRYLNSALDLSLLAPMGESGGSAPKP